MLIIITHNNLSLELSYIWDYDEMREPKLVLALKFLV